MIDQSQTASHLTASDEQTAASVFEQLIKSINVHYSGHASEDKKSKVATQIS